MASTADIKKGLCIKYNHDIYKIIEFLHVKPGKGPAFVRTKLKSLTNGKVLENTFPSGHKIEEVRVEAREFQYLYKDEEGFHFMNTEDFNQIYLPGSLVEKSEFLKEGSQVIIIYDSKEEKPLNVEFPTHVILEVIATDPGVKGDTVSNTYKPATLETGAIIDVPLFIKIGDKIKVNLEMNNSYVERVK